MAQLVKNPPAMWETWVQSLGWEDPLEKGKATHPSSGPVQTGPLYSPWSPKESDMTEQLLLFTVMKELTPRDSLIFVFIILAVHPKAEN